MTGDDNHDGDQPETSNHYPIWQVIQNGNGSISVTTNTNGMNKELPPKTTEEVVARENERKARTILLMALPEDHLAKFHKMADAKEIYQLDTLSFDDLYNNLRVFERDVKGTTASSSSNTQNVAFASADNTSNTNDISTTYSVSSPSVSKSQKEGSTSYTDEVIHSFFSNQSSAPQLDCDDLEQINDDDLEEMDLKWKVAMISMRINKFHKRTGRKLQFNTSDTIGFDKTKVECFNCHKIGHFARDCRPKRNQDSRRRDGGYNRNKARDNGRRPAYQDDLKALVTIDGEAIDWSRHVEEDTQNFTMMAYSSSNLSIDNEVQTCSKACADSYDRLKKLYDEQRDKLGDASVEITAYTLALKKFGLGYGDYRYGSILSYENEVLHSVVMNKECDLENTLVNDRYFKGMHTVPPPMIGNYTPSRPDVEIDYSKFTYGPKQTSVDELDSKPVEDASSDSDSSVELSTFDDPHKALKDKGIVDNGCSRHITGNKAHLADCQEFKGGSVTFGGSNRRITGPKEANHNACTEANDDQDGNLEEIDLRDKHLEELEKLKRQEKEANDAARKEATHEIQDVNTNNTNLLNVDIYASPSARIFTNSSYDDEGVVTDFNNLETTVNTRSKVHKNFEAHALEEEIDYDEVFAPVARIEAIRIFLAFASYSAFLHGTIDEELYELMKNRFQMSYMGELTFFLRLQVKQKEDGIFTSQDKYVAEILKKFDFFSVKTASTPIKTQKPLVKDEEDADVDVTPKTSHLQAMKRIFRYLKGQPKLGLWYPKASSFDLEACSDSDYAGVNLDRKSTTGATLVKGRLLEVTTSKQRLLLPSIALWHQQLSILPQTRSLTSLEHHLPSPSNDPIPDADKDNLKFQELMDLCIRFSNKVLNLESKVIDIKSSFTAMIQKLEDRVDQLKEENMVLKEKSFKTTQVDTAAPVKNMEKSFKQGRMIADMNEDVEEAQAKAYNLDLQHVKKVFSMQDINEKEPAKVEKVLEVVKAAKLMTEVVTIAQPTTTVAQVLKDNAPRKRRGVIIQDPKETAASVIVHIEVQSKEKRKGILIEEPKPLKGQAHIDMDEAFARQLEAELNANINWNDVIEQVKRSERQDNTMMRYQALKRKHVTKAQARKNMMIYLKNMAGFKMDLFKGMTYSEIRPIFEKHYNLIQAFLEKVEEEVPVQEEGNKRQGKSLKQDIAKKQRMDEEEEELKRHLQIVANDDDDDVFTEATPLASKLFLSFITLLKDFDREDLEALLKLVKERFETTEPKNFSYDFLLNILKIMFEKPNIKDSVWKDQKGRYRLAKQMLDNVRLKVEKESEMSLELLRLVKRQLNEGYKPE
uniref:CCHC-type domain-containing protein n=1 Tax=Tanacetum cinerariifolium TaxID=118510 RepID=A0A6L2NE45_TANCI|nr:hypothetical protein [Tanacetum cinerariifolium]